jgi:hypothetical protein
MVRMRVFSVWISACAMVETSFVVYAVVDVVVCEQVREEAKCPLSC